MAHRDADFRHRSFVFAACLVLFVAAASPAAARNSNKWRIQVSEGANSNGEIVFRFSPKGGTAFEVVVEVVKGTSENGVAKQIRATFEQQLDANAYAVEIDDGEDVLVKKAGDSPNFGLKVVRENVKGTRISLNRE